MRVFQHAGRARHPVAVPPALAGGGCRGRSYTCLVPLRAALLLGALLLTAGGCQRAFVRMGLSSAFRPAAARAIRGGWADPALQLYAGDMHFHVTPPDSPDEVHRDFDETVQLLSASGLDFVVVSPHVGPEIGWYPPARRAFAERLRELSRSLAARGSLPLVIGGMEYTNHRWGHATVSFVDLPALLDLDKPEGGDDGWLYRAAHDRGGLVVANHALVTPLDSSIDAARVDLSWRPLSRTAPEPWPADVAALDELLDGYEVYNVAAAQLRDRYLLGDTLATTTETLARLDAEILRRGRRLVPIGSTDSHEPFTRPTTFVAARTLSPAALRDGFAHGRVCVRSPAPCALAVFADEGTTSAGVGDAVRARRALALRWPGRGEVYRDGRSLGAFDGQAQLLVEDAACHIVRLALDGGYSGPVYVNCAFAD